MKRWYVLLRDWNNFKAGTRVELTAEDGAKLVADGTAKGPFDSQQAAVDWKPEVAGGLPAVTPPAAGAAPAAPPPTSGPPPSPAADILAACQLHWRGNPGRALQVATEIFSGGMTIDGARAHIEQRLRAENPPVGALPSSFNPAMPLGSTESESDKFHAVGTEAFALRLLRREPNEVRAAYEYASQVRPLMAGRRAACSPDAMRLSSMRLTDVAAECIFRSTGQDVRYLPAAVIADIALGNGRAHGFSAAEYHSPADLPNMILDAANVAFMRAFQIAPVSWNAWVEIGDPSEDYKTTNLVRVSEAGLIDDVPDGEELKQKKFTDSKETLVIQTRGNAWSFTRQMLIDGNTEGMRRMLEAVGRAFNVTINLTCYAILRGNPTMADGVALFHANHGNLVAGGAVPSKVQMEKVDALVAVQTDINGLNKINVPITFVLVPRAIWPTACEFFSSVTAPTQANPSVPNIWNPEIYKQLFRRNRAIQPIFDTALDGVANNPWYALTHYEDIPTILLRFLRGEEAPIMVEDMDKRTAGSLLMYGHQTWGVAPCEFRGIYKNPGV